jgi:hypothetical protein
MKLIEVRNIQGGGDISDGTFNGGEHTFMELEAGKNQTISVKLPNGEYVTFAFVPSQGLEIECVDIHSTVGQKFKYKASDSNDDIHFVQHAIGFSRWGDTVDTRKSDKPTGLLTLLLNKSHHETVKAKKDFVKV